MAYPGRRETPYTSTDFSTPGFKEPVGRSKEAFFAAMGSQRKKVENWDSSRITWSPSSSLQKEIDEAGARAYAKHGERGPYCEDCDDHHW